MLVLMFVACTFKLGLTCFCFFALDLMLLKEESQELSEIEGKDKKQHDFMTGEKSTQAKKTSRKRARKTKSESNYTCRQCGKSLIKNIILKST